MDRLVQWDYILMLTNLKVVSFPLVMSWWNLCAPLKSGQIIIPIDYVNRATSSGYAGCDLGTVTDCEATKGILNQATKN